ncbi:MAG: hypothetical protein ACJ76H_16990 [Bacteriovoracaceae bacterium]
MKILVTLTLIFLSSFAWGEILQLRTLMPDESVVRDDLQRILAKAELADLIGFTVTHARNNKAEIVCENDHVTIAVSGNERWSQAMYMSLQRMGFLFPHPRIQVSPTRERVLRECGKTFQWRPALKYAGFHFHTLHPNEWVHGFHLGEEDIAMDTVRWLARNQQNVFDIVLLRQDLATVGKNFKRPYALAKKFGIHAGICASFSMLQQNIYKLIDLPQTYSETASMKMLTERLNGLLDTFDASFIDLKMGTSEFTPVDYGRMIRWMDKAGQITKARGVGLIVKVHVSTNMTKPPYGNFNFLAQYSIPEVGILAHTVYLYGLADEKVRMYGNTDFKHILNFMLQEKSKRRAWFYPETSYFIALDIDTGLLLTDYLLTRASDMKILYDNKVEGQLNFTTGQEMGYWLFDWTVTLLNNLDYNFDPQVGLKLLGEDQDTWKRIIDYQHEYFKEKHLLGIITFQNFGDEIAGDTHVTLSRNPLKVLNENPVLLSEEIMRLENAIAAFPKDLHIANDELRLMMELTEIRLHHALKNREAFLHPAMMDAYLAEAVEFRNEAQKRMDRLKTKHRRYPSAMTWEEHKNPTAYPWGYAFGVSQMHYWEREEEVIRQKNFSPFFMNITDWWDIITKN